MTIGNNQASGGWRVHPSGLERGVPIAELEAVLPSILYWHLEPHLGTQLAGISRAIVADVSLSLGNHDGRQPLPEAAANPLDARQTEILRLISYGLNSEGIAQKTQCPVGIVTRAIPKISKELGAATHAHAVGIGFRQAILQPDVVSDGEECPTKPLTPREQNCLHMLVDGKFTSEMAYTLKISPRTVETYCESLRKKLAARNRAHAIRQGVNLGFLSIRRQLRLDIE